MSSPKIVYPYWYSGAKHYIEEALDPGSVLRQGVERGEITRKTAREEARKVIEFFVANGAETGTLYNPRTLTPEDIAAYLIELIEEHEGEAP